MKSFTPEIWLMNKTVQCTLFFEARRLLQVWEPQGKVLSQNNYRDKQYYTTLIKII